MNKQDFSIFENFLANLFLFSYTPPMQPILDTLRKSLSLHYRGNKMIGTIALQTVKDFFQIEKKAENVIRDKEPIEGYVKNGKLFLRTNDQATKIESFKRKRELLTHINQQLQNL
jgi:hypothetical protein